MLTLAGVLGHPVGHSRSPAMHNAAFEALGLEWRYVKLPVPPEDLEQAVRALPESGYRGVNVTIPHKEAALALADDASDAARAIGAAREGQRVGGADRARTTPTRRACSPRWGRTRAARRRSCWGRAARAAPPRGRCTRRARA